VIDKELFNMSYMPEVLTQIRILLDASGIDDDSMPANYDESTLHTMYGAVAKIKMALSDEDEEVINICSEIIDSFDSWKGRTMPRDIFIVNGISGLIRDLEDAIDAMT
jgi:hypothetical protein